MTYYLDTSAAAKLLVEEAESEVLSLHLDGLDPDEPLVSAWLLETELRRLAVRQDLDQADVTDLLSRVDLVEVPRSLFHEAGILPGANLRSLDALHLATCLRLGDPVVVAYDRRLLDAAASLGLRSLSPA